MKYYSDSYYKALIEEPGIRPIVIIVHDNWAVTESLGGAIYEEGFYPKAYETGEALIKAINKDSTLITKVAAVMVHKDLGQYKPSISSIELMKRIREFPAGDEIRTGVISGEFTDRGVSSTAREVIGADFGYDPTGWEGLLPGWAIKMIRLGRLSESEIEECRHKQMVVNSSQAELRVIKNHKKRGVEFS